MNIYFIRHGQSYVNLANWDHSNTETGLTELGQRQAAALARHLPVEVPQVHAIYASTMLRAKETAETLAHAYGITIRYDDRLREVGNNRLDHSPWPDELLPDDYAEFWGSERPFVPLVKREDEGETWMHFRMRVGLFLEEMVERHHQQHSEQTADGDTILAVCHGGVIEAVLDHVFNVGHSPYCEVWAHNTSITRLQYVKHPGRETWRLRYHNRVDHLHGVEEGIFF